MIILLKQILSQKLKQERAMMKRIYQDGIDMTSFQIKIKQNLVKKFYSDKIISVTL